MSFNESNDNMMSDEPYGSDPSLIAYMVYRQLILGEQYQEITRELGQPQLAPIAIYSRSEE